MAHSTDLDTTTPIMGGSHVRAIGWLSAEHSYPKGPVPRAFLDRLRSFCARWGDSIDALNWGVAGGWHTCELCNEFRASGNFGVPAGAVLFVAPQMVGHYVEKHGYLPPQEFIEAVLAAPMPGTSKYADAVEPFIGLELLEDPGAVGGASHLSAAALMDLVKARIDAKHLTVDAYGYEIGWDVTSVLADPERLRECPFDMLRALCGDLGLDWRSVLDAPRRPR
jgi:hypothetical protein